MVSEERFEPTRPRTPASKAGMSAFHHQGLSWLTKDVT